MRVPFPIVIVLVFLVVLGTWWHGTRGRDFLTPPTAEELAEIRERVKASIPAPDEPEEELAVPAPAPDPMKPSAGDESEIPLGNLGVAPRLAEYADAASRGADKLMSLALLLETEGEFQRALLAWERTIDMGNADAGQMATALAAIARLRPTLPDWNTDAEKAIPVVLHAGTDHRSAKALKPALVETAARIERSAAGILKVSVDLATSRSEIAATGPSPVALWLSGPGKEFPTTEVISFTSTAGSDLESECARALHGMIRAYLIRNTTLETVPALGDDANPKDALATHLTRLAWRDLGVLLNRVPETEEKAE